MTLRRFFPRTPALRTGAGLAALSLLALGIGTASPEAVVAERFATALESPRELKAETARNVALVSGSEAYWLAERRKLESAGAALEPAAWNGAPFAAVAIGDRITVSGTKGTRVFEVVAINDVEHAAAARTLGDADKPHRVTVTCRDLASPNGADLVTFETTRDASGAIGRSARAL